MSKFISPLTFNISKLANQHLIDKHRYRYINAYTQIYIKKNERVTSCMSPQMSEQSTGNGAGPRELPTRQ